jgi:hypothetical protein
MLTTSRRIRVAALVSLFAVGCGGASSSNDDGPDSSLDGDSGGAGQGIDGAGNPGLPDGAVSPGPDAGTTTSDGGSVTPDGAGAMLDGALPDGTGATTDGALPDGALPDGALPDGALPDAGPKPYPDGAGCGVDADCQNTHCVSGICCASACAAPTACQSGATCAGGSTCVYPNVADSTVCDDGNACTSGETCQSGVCGSGATVSCDDGNPCTDDACDTVLGCEHHNNTATCDDGNPCTVLDVCAAGLCQGSPMDCSAKNDACNVGVCNTGTCGKSAKPDGTPCNDNLACTVTDACTAGVCTGSGNSCGPNSSACAEGPPKACTCTGSFMSSGGQCVPNACVSSSPCVSNATCSDPSGTVVCTCPTGFTGDGKTAGTGCTLIDNCIGNPCGAGLGTCVNGVNAHTCNCNAGYVSVNGACVCDMNGTFALQSTLKTSWPVVVVFGINIFEAGTNVSTNSWALRSQTYNSSGQLVIKTTQCGGTTADLCGVTSPIDDAYAAYFPSTIYGLGSMPVGTLSITLTNPLPGQAYTEPQSATLLGISLKDPLGAWPAAAANVGAGANQTNGAIWVDSDNDGFAGVTSYSVPPGGILHTTSPFPIADYPSASTACPRGNPAAARLPYNYLPGVNGFTLEDVKRLYTAQRIISSMSGTITSCDATGVTLIQGALGGPDNGQVHADARVDGCVQVNGSGESNCSSTVANQYDGQNQTDQITGGSFILKRVPSTATCADVRALSFP